MAAGTAAALPGLGFAPAAAAQGPALSPGRARTLAALVSAVGAERGNAIDPREGGAAADALGREYPEHNADIRRTIDIVLDTIEDGPSDGRFSDLDDEQRLRFLRSWLARPRSGSATAADTRRITIAQSGIDLAARFFYADPVEFHPAAVTV